MTATSAFAGTSVLVVGGAGFVGGALVRRLLDAAPRRLVIVDNLLSADISNVPEHPTVDFVLGSIADDRVLAALPRDLDYVFHLACYHGNQSSIHDPLADHDNNTMTSLKLFEWLKECRSLQEGRLCRGGLRRCGKDLRARRAAPPRTPRFRCSTTARIRFPS